jgi:hypothetical protein
VSVKEREMTGVLNSVVFDTNPAVDFSFQGMCVMVRKEEAIILKRLSRLWEGVQISAPIHSNTSFISCFAK